MGIIIRQSLKTTVVTYIGVFLGYISVLIVQPYCLTPEEIGLFRVLVDASVIFAFFAQLGIPNIAIKFFPEFNSVPKQRKQFLFFLLAAPLVGIFFFNMLFIIFKSQISGWYIENSALFVEYFWYVLPMGFAAVYFNVLESYARVNLRVTIPSVISQVMMRAFFISIILLYYFGIFSLTATVNNYLIAHFISIVAILFYIIRQGWFKIETGLDFLKGKWNEVASYGIFNIIGGMSGIVFYKMDILMLSSMDGLANTGIYSIAFFAATVIEIPKRAVNLIITPIVSDALTRNDIAKVNELYHKSSINQGIASMLLLVLLWVNLDSLFLIMPNSEIYTAGKYVVMLVALGKIIEIFLGINDSIMITSKYYRTNVYFTLALLPLGFLLNYIMIPKWSITGAALGTLISLLLFSAVKLFFVWKKFGIQPFNSKTAVLLAVSAAVFFVGAVMPSVQHPILDVALKTAVMAPSFIAAVYYFKISDDINSLIDEGWRKISGK